MVQTTVYAMAFRLQTVIAHPLALSLTGHGGRKTFHRCKLLSLLLSNNPAGRNAAVGSHQPQAEPSLPPSTFFFTSPIFQAPLSPLITAGVQMLRIDLDTKGQNTPVRSIPGSHQQLFGSHLGAHCCWWLTQPPNPQSCDWSPTR